jgi:ribose transport system permease protein
MMVSNSTTHTSVATRPSVAAIARVAAPLLVFLALLVAVSLAQPAFLTGTGPSILIYQAVPVLILALGQSAVLMTGGIDLSNAALAVLSSVLVATFLGPLGSLAPVATVLIVSSAGLLTGLLVTVFQVPSFAVTLGMLGFWQSVALLVTQQQTIYIDTNGEALFWMTDYLVLGLQPIAYIGVALAILFWIGLKWTRYGVMIRAIGLNELTAILSGIRTRVLKIAAFTLSGFCASIAGIVITAQQGTASASGLGNGLLLPAIAAALLGGVSITGGVGNPLNVVVGALIVTLIPIGSSVVGFDPKLQQIVFGVALIIAVAATLDRKALLVIK